MKHLECGMEVRTKCEKLKKKVLETMPYKHLRKDDLGWFQGWVPGTNLKMLWVKHRDKSLAAYMEEEVHVK